jgi:hypothetical protein
MTDFSVPARAYGRVEFGDLTVKIAGLWMRPENCVVLPEVTGTDTRLLLVLYSEFIDVHSGFGFKLILPRNDASSKSL